MKRRSILIISSVGVLAVVMLIVAAGSGENDFKKKYEGINFDSEYQNTDRVSSYQAYLSTLRGAAYPPHDIHIPAESFDRTSSSGITVIKGEGPEGVALRTEESSKLFFHIKVPTSGFYNLELSWRSVPSRGVDMERSLKIDGKNPFREAERFSFTRLWTDAESPRTDNRGNQIRPAQKEVFQWQRARISDELGYESEPFKFYLSEGTHQLSIEGISEPLLVSDLRLAAIRKDIDYQTYRSMISANKGGASGQRIVIQGETAKLRSDPSLFAKYDRSSASTDPVSITRTILNYIGGDAWRSPGQWIEWEVSVPESGWYRISFKARQRYARGYIANRALYINGEIPFNQMRSLPFRYSTDWSMASPSGEDGKPREFWPEKGSNRIRLEATLGEMGSLIAELEESIFRLNKIYRTILVLTGTNPDQFRDYNLDKIYPEEIAAMALESKRLYRMVDRVVAYTGQKSDRIAAAQTLAIQLETFAERPEKITKAFVSFKDNITALGTSLLSLTETKTRYRQHHSYQP
jgi:hypothetical protein